MSEQIETEMMVHQQQLFIEMQRAKFAGDMPTVQRIRRQLAMGGIRIEFANNYRDKAQQQPGE